LTPRDVTQIWLTDGGSKGSQLVFSAAEGNVMETRWPPALRSRECDAARQNFEQARDAAIQELRAGSGQMTRETEERLLGSVDGLFVALEDAYPEPWRKQNPKEILPYIMGKRYIQSLLAQVSRARTTEDRSVFDQSRKFQGDSVVDLLQHMYRNGLLFSSPHAGGEELYKRLFMTMRNLYLNLVTEPPTRGGQRG